MYILLLLCPLGGFVAGGGGRMLDPPGRGSLWRAGIKSNQDYDDHRYTFCMIIIAKLILVIGGQYFLYDS